ncbi:PLD nuclease N-terminal domain-containing protein [Lewinella sp. IMCC34183]|uniref:PLD nuclease N-terminal domain-containing protein n=1 Tax=Lewinella sp. IMCC34183 TaxID=2248762 RepID=UPI000E21ED22|nr:PLD nuclease N-terminal domain-containing protein [Lewinella sp. IMCC34183]
MNIRKFLPLTLLLGLSILLTACGEDVSGGEVIAGGIGIYVIGSILAFLLVVWAVVDLLKKPYPMEKKIIWGIVILVIPFLGAVLYFVLGRNKQSVV